MKERKVFYYEDEINDDFAFSQLEKVNIDENYVYNPTSLFKKFTHFFWYRIFILPIAVIYTKCKFHHKVVNKHLLKEASDTGYFIYGNHTQPIADAFIPTLINFPRTVSVIVNSANLRIPFLGKVLPSMGALPLPSNVKATKNFTKAVEERVLKKHCICIYPEANIWPYYTSIRPFIDSSLRYPIKYDVPTYCFTNTYQKRKHSSKVNIVTYIDGPFYADKTLNLSEQKKDLRNKIYQAMLSRSKNSNYDVIIYRKKGENDD